MPRVVRSFMCDYCEEMFVGECECLLHERLSHAELYNATLSACPCNKEHAIGGGSQTGDDIDARPTTTASSLKPMEDKNNNHVDHMNWPYSKTVSPHNQRKRSVPYKLHRSIDSTSITSSTNHPSNNLLPTTNEHSGALLLTNHLSAMSHPSAATTNALMSIESALKIHPPAKQMRLLKPPTSMDGLGDMKPVPMLGESADSATEATTPMSLNEQQRMLLNTILLNQSLQRNTPDFSSLETQSLWNKSPPSMMQRSVLEGKPASAPNPSHECPYCGKLMHSRAAVKVHERTHTGERPFACNICGQSFVQNMHMRRHQMNIHGVWDAVANKEKLSFQAKCAEQKRAQSTDQ